MNDTSNTNGSTRASRTISFFKERLMRDAEKVQEKDIEGLDESVPKKLAGIDVEKLGNSMKWVNVMIDRVRSLFEMIRDKEYKISTRSKALIAAGLIYFVLPTDIVPDFIPGIGYIDDAVVLTILWRMIEEEVESYMQSKRRLTPE